MKPYQRKNSVFSLLNTAYKKLKKFSESPRLDAEVLLSFVLKKDRIFLYSNPEFPVNKKLEKKFWLDIQRRKKYEPIAYIKNHKKFFSLPFYVDKNVLIPRPDTELLVEKIIKQTKDQRPKTISDIGTGSGCMAIALKKYLPQSKIIATDISQKALKVAKKNAKINNVKLKFICSDLFDRVPKKYLGKIDIIVANLPYLPKNVTKKRSLKYEPKIALQDKQYLPKFLKQAKKYLSPCGKIFLETNKSQVNIIKKSGLPCEYITF